MSAEEDLALRKLILDSLIEVRKTFPNATVWQVGDLLWGRITRDFLIQERGFAAKGQSAIGALTPSGGTIEVP